MVTNKIQWEKNKNVCIFIVFLSLGQYAILKGEYNLNTDQGLLNNHDSTPLRANSEQEPILPGRRAASKFKCSTHTRINAKMQGGVQEHIN